MEYCLLNLRSCISRNERVKALDHYVISVYIHKRERTKNTYIDVIYEYCSLAD